MSAHSAPQPPCHWSYRPLCRRIRLPPLHPSCRSSLPPPRGSLHPLRRHRFPLQPRRSSLRHRRGVTQPGLSSWVMVWNGPPGRHARDDGLRREDGVVRQPGSGCWLRGLAARGWRRVVGRREMVPVGPFVKTRKVR